jgi:hypothetical protein
MQGEFLQKRLIKRMGYKPNANVKGCTIDLRKEAEEADVEKLDNEVRLILKQCKNNPELIVEFFKEHKTEVYRVKNSKKVLKFIGEEEGFIVERKGMTALKLNMVIGNGFSFDIKPMVILDADELDVYNLMHYLHKWCAYKNGMKGFEEKAYRLLKKFNTKNDDEIIQRLSISDIELLKNAIARDVQSINFVVKYSKENAGAKNALEKMHSDDGASI